MTEISAIQAVTFDVGGTLIQPWPSVGHVYAEVAARHGVENLSPENINEQFRAAWRAKTNFNHTREDWAALVERTFTGLTQGKASETFFSELYERFGTGDAWRIFDDVLPALDALATAGVRLAVISNWDERLRPLLQQLKLSDYFETVIVSCEAGFAKPSPVIFEHALKKLGLPPGSILHVGDNLSADVQGARGAGLRAVRIDRKSPAVAGQQIASLSDLESLCAR
ncbi:MAG: HAD-IA family hydrolase [Verrucomicrobia bacterium]|nr:HAD-IA family hydrolase [Verrucomicrobiota bacterium]